MDEVDGMSSGDIGGLQLLARVRVCVVVCRRVSSKIEESFVKGF